MPYTLHRLTPINGEAVLPLADAKAHLRVEDTSWDAVITSMRNTAVNHVERVTGVPLAPAQFMWAMTSFPQRIDLPMRPVVSIGMVAYTDIAGGNATYAEFRRVGSSVYPALGGSWPAAYGNAAVTFTAGLSSPDEAPDLISAAKIRLEILYDRGGSDPRILLALEDCFNALIASYRPVLV